MHFFFNLYKYCWVGQMNLSLLLKLIQRWSKFKNNSYANAITTTLISEAWIMACLKAHFSIALVCRKTCISFLMFIRAYYIRFLNLSNTIIFQIQQQPPLHYQCSDFAFQIKCQEMFISLVLFTKFANQFLYKFLIILLQHFTRQRAYFTGFNKWTKKVLSLFTECNMTFPNTWKQMSIQVYIIQDISCWLQPRFEFVFEAIITLPTLLFKANLVPTPDLMIHHLE